jgi:hypothetical protein
MPCDLPDLGAVEADVREGPIVELGELPNGNPVSPPRGEALDKRSEVHFPSSFQVWRAAHSRPDASLSVPSITKFNE